MATLKALPARRAAPWLLATLTACFPTGPDFASSRQLRGVRVLGTLAEPASGTPAGEVQLSVEAFDAAPLVAELRRAGSEDAGSEDAGSEDAGAGPTPAPLSVAWLGGCHNPPGDSQAGCYPLLQQIARALPDPLPSAGEAIPEELAPFFGVGRSFALRVPADILEGRRLMTAAPPFGVSFSFFAVCRGLLRPAPDASGGVPLTCHDPETGQRQDSEAFVPGFVTTYSYERDVNRSPSLRRSPIDGFELPERSCDSDADCAELQVGSLPTACARPLTAAFSLEADPEPRRCLPVVPSCARLGCESYELLPELDPLSVERDAAAAPPGGRAPDETLWVKYFGFGGFSREEALIHDRDSGFNPDYALRWTPPPIAPDSPLPIWAVVQDNRGGTAIARWDFLVRP